MTSFIGVPDEQVAGLAASMRLSPEGQQKLAQLQTAGAALRRRDPGPVIADPVISDPEANSSQPPPVFDQFDTQGAPATGPALNLDTGQFEMTPEQQIESARSAQNLGRQSVRTKPEEPQPIDPANLVFAGGPANQPTPAQQRRRGQGGATTGLRGALRDASAEASDAISQSQNMMEDASARAVRAAEKQAAAEEKVASRTGEILAERDAQVQNFEAARQELELQRRDQLKAASDNLQQLRQEVRQMKVDPRRLYKTESGDTDYVKTVGAALMAAAGHFGAALSGGPNTASQLINTAVERDIAAQRDAIDNAQADVQGQQSYLAELRQRFGDDRQAEEAMRLSYLEDASRRIETMKAQTSNEMVAANLDATLAQIEQDKAASQARYAEAAEARVQRNVAAQSNLTAQQLGNQVKRQQLAQMQGSGQQGLGVPGLRAIPGARVDKESIKEAREIKAAKDEVMTMINRLRQSTDRVGFWDRAQNAASVVPGIAENPDVARANVTASALKKAVNKLDKAGALDSGALELLNLAISDPASFSVEANAAKLAELPRLISDSANAKMRAYGIEDVSGIQDFQEAQ